MVIDNRFQGDEYWVLWCGEKQWANHLSSSSNSMPKQEGVCVLGCIPSNWGCKYDLCKEIIQCSVSIRCLPHWYPPLSSALKIEIYKLIFYIIKIKIYWKLALFLLIYVFCVWNCCEFSRRIIYIDVFGFYVFK